MNPSNFIPKCKELVYEYARSHIDKTDEGALASFTEEDVYVVWYSKTLQNAKALLSTNLPDGMYYELTLNGNKNEIYFDAYKKFENKKIELEEQ
ncbi:DUF6275 family protein [Rummeliibacillus sp. TYF-LIM-RU47]|uniref:DUF6275 family protein n=1 Tax=Rummeliibacillus sp. TYF-LIM-RU47 TaxID=2608406 RepID=UPI00123B2D35|nr:DUF6275 family protein [Rummeliibacillus sp. TYF-LIM-RU47]